jgi:hypothetical protein
MAGRFQHGQLWRPLQDGRTISTRSTVTVQVRPISRGGQVAEVAHSESWWRESTDFKGPAVWACCVRQTRAWISQNSFAADFRVRTRRGTLLPDPAADLGGQRLQGSAAQGGNIAGLASKPSDSPDPAPLHNSPPDARAIPLPEPGPLSLNSQLTIHNSQFPPVPRQEKIQVAIHESRPTGPAGPSQVQP